MYLLSEVIKPFILCRSHPIAIAENYERPGTSREILHSCRSGGAGDVNARFIAFIFFHL